LSPWTHHIGYFGGEEESAEQRCNMHQSWV